LQKPGKKEFVHERPLEQHRIIRSNRLAEYEIPPPSETHQLVNRLFGFAVIAGSIPPGHIIVGPFFCLQRRRRA
jgi:hypothetical protein